MENKLSVRVMTQITEADKVNLTALAQQVEHSEAWVVRKALLDYLERNLKVEK